MPTTHIGVVSCSGECCGYGTISRIATRLLMEDLRPNCVTICLPLYSSGDHEENQFAKDYPTITVDGCPKKCATIATETLSGPVRDQVEVTSFMKELGILKEFPRRNLGEEGISVARKLSDLLAEKVDVIIKQVGE